ncbi:amino acid adenylation domain-containing protein [Paenibacillus campi]|uniref:non-ribosomal peptide synthetase n=1 Tax=Paenibacillus campi TaxID=3106031 RepID=UPI002AFE45A9|nr:amino acid adenylation domain-containing protein [Paenibacillus sp. SGZ-1009]
MTYEHGSDQKKKLAAFLQKRMSKMDEQAIPNREPNLPVPLSFAQQRLWFFDQLSPGNVAYNDPLIFEIQGTIDAAVLEASINTIIQRHESLRTTFETDAQGEPIQVIKSQLELTFKHQNLTSVAVEQQEAYIRQQFDEEALLPFELDKGPLIRIGLIKAGEQKHFLQVTLHHIVFDGWTLTNFLKELKVIYEAKISNQMIPLAELSIQYPDFAVWQRKQFQGNRMENQHHYWREQLQGANTILELPADESRPNQWSFDGDNERLMLNKDIVNNIQQLSKQENVTQFITLFSLFAILMYKYTEQEDLIIGFANANRNKVEIEPLIGFFVNMLPIRTKFDSNMNFYDVLEQVRIHTLGAMANQDIPFEQLVKMTNVQRDASRSPLVQVTFSLQTASHIPSTLHEASFELVEYVIPTSKFDISMDLSVHEDGLLIFCSYNKRIFKKAKIQTLLQHFEHLAHTLIAHPRRPISEVPLLSSAEQQHLISTFGKNEKDYASRGKSIHHIFADICVQYPDKMALKYKDTYLSYQQLDALSNQVAHFIAAHNDSNQPVGICMDRSLEMIVGLLGILKSGSAYVPIDSSYPVDRIHRIIHDAKVNVILTSNQHASTFDSNTNQVIIYDEQQLEKYAAAPIDYSLNEAKLAYIIFTSGSTGTPKGVKIGHDAVVNFTSACIDMMDITPQDHILQFASLSFDVSVFEIFAALLSGASLYLDDKETLMQADLLTKIMVDNQISIVDLPPVMLTYLDAAAFPALRLMFIGTEAFSGELVNRWKTTTRRFINAYGPTEATCAVTFEECEGNYKFSPPIGKPMPNQELYVLNKHRQLVPIGVPGELYISGVGLAQGYINQEQLNEQLFVPNPYSTTFPRMYKTGDLVKWLPNGSLEYLGRIDNQVKIKGFRIELGEIAAVLYKHEHIQNVHITVREDLPSGKGLVAYLVGVDHVPNLPGKSELRNYLARDLPNYMIPQYFEYIEALPLNASGKVDAKQLPIPDFNKKNDAEYSQPTTQIEKEIATMYETILGIKAVAIDESFFDLGGDSLQATQLISRLKNLFQIDIPLQVLFVNPNIADLIHALKEIEPEIEEHLELLSILEEMSEDDVKSLLQ